MFDVTKQAQITAALAHVTQANGVDTVLWGLVNNAGTYGLTHPTSLVFFFVPTFLVRNPWWWVSNV